MDLITDLLGITKRPEIPKGLLMGELAINVAQHQGDPLMKALKPTLFFAVPTQMNVKDLRHRVHGITHIPMNRIRLMLCGEVLKDHEMVPDWAFELTKKVSEDDDLFKARIFLSLLPIIEDDEPQSDESVLSELSEEEMDEEDQKALEDLKAEKEAAEKKEEEERLESEAKAKEIEAQALAHHHKKTKYFDLSKDLERIECKHFAPMLKEAGFRDEGTFSEITDEVLTQNNLYVPKRSRVRIVALADSIKRRIDQRMNKQTSKALAEVNAGMRDAGKNKGRAIEGMDGAVNNKADVNRMFAEKEKARREADRERRLSEQAAERRAFLRLHPEPKPHDEKLKHAIELIRWKNERDEFDIPKNVLKVLPASYCCKKHEKEVLERRGVFIKERRERLYDEVESAVRVADKGNSGFLRREILRVVATTLFKEKGFSITDGEVEKLLDDAQMEGPDQHTVFQWIGKCKYRAENPIGFMPVEMYDSKYFCEKIIEMLNEFEFSRLIMREEDKVPRYVERDTPGKRKKKGKDGEELPPMAPGEEPSEEADSLADMAGGGGKGAAAGGSDSRRHSSVASSRRESRRNSDVVALMSQKNSVQK
jgi:hypothetical protein